MIITIALGVMLGLFLTAAVVRVLAEPGCVTALAWTVGIVVAIVAAVVVLPLLPPVAIGIAVWAAVGLLLVWFAIALTVAVRRNGGWLPRDKDGRPRWW